VGVPQRVGILEVSNRGGVDGLHDPHGKIFLKNPRISPYSARTPLEYHELQTHNIMIDFSTSHV